MYKEVLSNDDRSQKDDFFYVGFLNLRVRELFLHIQVQKAKFGDLLWFFKLSIKVSSKSGNLIIFISAIESLLIPLQIFVTRQLVDVLVEGTLRGAALLQ